jgi:hypothetical protein
VRASLRISAAGPSRTPYAMNRIPVMMNPRNLRNLWIAISGRAWTRSDAKAGDNSDGAKWGQSHGALASDSARYSPHLGGTVPVFAVMSPSLAYLHRLRSLLMSLHVRFLPLPLSPSSLAVQYLAWRWRGCLTLRANRLFSSPLLTPEDSIAR